MHQHSDVYTSIPANF